MKLADKIIKLRKQSGWSQEDLAEKMNVSRQSVSKWEGALSIPDLNKIIKLGEIFGVSTDYLLKDDVESFEARQEDDDEVRRVGVTEARSFVDLSFEHGKTVAKGVLLIMSSVIPLLFLLGLAESENMILDEKIALGVGLTTLFILIASGIIVLIGSNDKGRKLNLLKMEAFDLEYGVDSILKEGLESFSPKYHRILGVAVSAFVISPVPLILSGVFEASDMFLLLMLVLLIGVVAGGVFILVPVSAKYNAYNLLLKEGDFNPKERERNKPIERFAAFYWPLVTAIFIGWSLATMDWGITWIVWPVAGILFGAFAGLIHFIKAD